MGYEIVEGQVAGKTVSEKARLSFVPRGGPPAREEEESQY